MARIPGVEAVPRTGNRSVMMMSLIHRVTRSVKTVSPGSPKGGAQGSQIELYRHTGPDTVLTVHGIRLYDDSRVGGKAG